MTITTVHVTLRSSDARDAIAAGMKIGQYLPSSYAVTEVLPAANGGFLVVVQGYDQAGFTAEGYIIPRLASGLYPAKVMEEA